MPWAHRLHFGLVGHVGGGPANQRGGAGESLAHGHLAHNLPLPKGPQLQLGEYGQSRMDHGCTRG
jgi:hypothetical protein